MTVRESIMNARSGTRRGSFARALLDEALEKLDNSREVTEKVTTVSRGYRADEESGCIDDRFLVTTHKARVVLDD